MSILPLAQLGGRTTLPSYTSQEMGKVLPKPKTFGGAVAYAVLGLILLAIIFGLVIKFFRDRH